MRKCGTIALIGPPNAGKSTLLNSILRTKLAIVCHKRQTTRTCVAGIHLEGETQMVFLDTPGIFNPKKPLERRMVAAAWHSIAGAEAVLLLVDATRDVRDHEIQKILNRLRKIEVRVDLVLNKVDLVKKNTLLPKAHAYIETGVVDQIFMISAKKQDGMDHLLAHLDTKMPEGDWQYPEDQLSNLPQKLLAAEITREKVMHHAHEEIPYELTVLPELWEPQGNGSIKIMQTILVKEEGHKPILLGKGGQKLKAIGTEARQDIEILLESKVHLVLHIRSDSRWQEKAQYFSETGLGCDDD